MEAPAGQADVSRKREGPNEKNKLKVTDDLVIRRTAHKEKAE